METHTKDTASVRTESPTQATPTSLPTITPAVNEAGEDPDEVVPTSAMFGQNTNATPEQQRLQEEYMKALFGGNVQGQSGPGPGPGQQSAVDENDAMLKMMQSMLGGMSGDPNAPNDLPFSADDISKMTGMPSFLTSMFMGGKAEAPVTPAQARNERTWKILRTVLSVLVALYTIVTIDRSVSLFGQNPPTPATVQNPFVVFVMAELLINGTKTVLPGRPATSGVKHWYATGKEAARDGAIVVFMLGMYTWFRGPI